MKKQKILNWVGVALIIFIVTSCNDPLKIDSGVDRSRYSGLPAGAGTAGLTPSLPTSNSWIPIADFQGRRIGAASFALFEKVAFVGTGFILGSDGVLTRTKDFWKYDPSNNTWTQVADFGGAARVYAASFGIGGKGYVGTGAGTSKYKDFWEYDFNSNLWTQKADFSGEARDGAAGLAIGSKGYIGTGIGFFDHKKDFWEYNPAADVWIQKADFGGNPRVFAGGFTLTVAENGTMGDKGFLGAGYAQNIGLFDFWKYNPSTNAWKQVASLSNSSNPGHSGFFSIGKKGYVGGNGQLWMFDPVVNSWVRKADFPGNMMQGVGFSIWGFGYIGVGNYASGSANHGAFYKYIPD